PSDVTAVRLEAVGGAGGSAPRVTGATRGPKGGGAGARAQADLVVSGGQTLYAEVGEAGEAGGASAFNGGGAAGESAASGGGASGAGGESEDCGTGSGGGGGSSYAAPQARNVSLAIAQRGAPVVSITVLERASQQSGGPSGPDSPAQGQPGPGSAGQTPAPGP